MAIAIMHTTPSAIPSYVFFVALNIGYGVPFTSGTKSCEGYPDCAYKGFTCKNNKCICDPDSEIGLFTRCENPKKYSEKCSGDYECAAYDPNSYCAQIEIRICKCRRLYIYDSEKKHCVLRNDEEMYSKFDPVRDLIIPAIIVMTIGAMVYLGLKVFCNWGKIWRRRRHQEITRELEEISATPHQQATWIASYRVFSPYNNASRSSSGLSPTSFPIHPTPCMGLFVPSQTISTSPPPYEEALKHKVILSSYHPPNPPIVPAYTLPPPDISRQYQTLPGNASGPSSTIILNQNPSNASTIRISTMSGPRSLPIIQTDNNYPGLSASNDPVWNQLPYSGTTGQIWNPQHPSTINRSNPEATDRTDNSTSESVTRNTDVWMPQQPNNRNTQPQQQLQQTPPTPQQQQPPQSQTEQQQQQQQQLEMQNRTNTFRSGPTQRTYQSTDSTRSVPISDHSN